MIPWQPKTLLQLVLAGFLAAIVPLCLAVYFTTQSLTNLAESNRHLSKTLVDVTRLSQAIGRDILELERHSRQYLARNDPELRRLFITERDAVLANLHALQTVMQTDATELVQLIQSIEAISLPPVLAEGEEAEARARVEQLQQAYTQGNTRVAAAEEWLQDSIDQLVEQNTLQAEKVIDYLTLQLAVLAAATLAVLLMVSYWVNKPLQELTQEIHELGTEGLDRKIEVSGPQELEAVGSKLEWLRNRLMETEEQKRSFLRHISHELKTPLASLREGADLLAEQVTGHLSQQQQEIVGIVQNNALELQRLIENLLDYNQIPSQQLKLEPIALAPLLDDLMTAHQLTIKNKDLQISIEGGVEQWLADRRKLKTVLDNLLSNAVNYTPDGGRIEISYRESGGELVLEMANSGEAIPAEDAERVFEPFFQSTARRTGPIKGSGIGLSVARECIEIHGGQLALCHHPSLPVCFRLTCPARSS